MRLSPTKVFSTVTKAQRCCRGNLEAYIFLSGNKLLCSLTAILRRAILFRERTQLWKVPLIDVSHEKFHRYEQGCKNKKLVCTKFPLFLQTPKYFFSFVIVRCEQNPTHIHTFVVCGVTCLSQDLKKSLQRLIMAPNNARCLYLILSTFHLTVFRLLTCCLSFSLFRRNLRESQLLHFWWLEWRPSI